MLSTPVPIRFLWILVALLAGCPPASGQMDVIVSATSHISKDGTVGDITGYSLSTTSCNIGDDTAIWIASTNEHPVIAQNLYRIQSGFLEQIGQSWLKHGFCAVNEPSCGDCQSTPCATLGVNCADTYGASLNGDQANLGPRSGVNPSSGFYDYPFPTQGQTGDAIYKRLQVHNDDLDPSLNPRAGYFAVVQYVTTDEPAFDRHHNNNSYREVEVGSLIGGGYDIGYTGPTITESDAIHAWCNQIAGVQREVVSVREALGSGELVVGHRAEDLGGDLYRYQYAIFNNTSHRSARSLTIPLPPNVTVSNLAFHDVDYHSGEPFSGADWTVEVQPSELSWSTQTFSENPDANAIRWGTTYSFRFDADAPPGSTTAVIGLFRPGSGDEVPVGVVGPSDPPPLMFNYTTGLPSVIDPDGDAFPVEITGATGVTLDSSTPTLHYDDGTRWFDIPLVPASGNTWDVDFPSLACGGSVNFFLSARTTQGEEVRDPFAAPSEFHSRAIADGEWNLLDELETDTGWQVGGSGDDASTGHWERVDPIGTGAQPGADHSPSPGTHCFVTGQGLPGGSIGENDVDGGQTTLFSPVLDLATRTDPRVSYWRWFSNDAGSAPNSDVFSVEITDDGRFWSTVETVGPDGAESSGGWFLYEFRVLDHVALTDSVRLRFVASDLGAGSIVEAAIDDFSIQDLICEVDPMPLSRGDCNGDGAHDISDPIQLLDLLFASGSVTCDDACDADDNESLGLPDAITILDYLFQLGPDLPPPFPNCGDDPAGRILGCEHFAACP